MMIILVLVGSVSISFSQPYPDHPNGAGSYKKLTIRINRQWALFIPSEKPNLLYNTPTSESASASPS